MQIYFGEELTHVGKGFELQRVARRIEKEHRCLFAHLTFEANIRLDDEFDLACAEPFSQLLPVCDREDDPEVWDGYIMSINWIVVVFAVFGRFQMSDDLVSEQVEVDPLCGTATFRTAKCSAIESAGSIKIVDRKGNMKRGQRHEIVSLETIIR